MTTESTSTEEKLVTGHLALVASIAQKLADTVPPNITLEELIAFGQEGLVQAARRYDPNRGVAFTTFAYYRIRGAMFDGVRQLGPALHSRRRVAFEEKADLYLEQRSNEPPPETAVAAAEKLTEMVSDLALAYVITRGDVGERADHSTPDPSEVAEKREEFELLSENFSKLPDKERQLIQMMYFEDKSLVEAARQLEMTKGWASRLHARALSRLRKGTFEPQSPHVMMRV